MNQDAAQGDSPPAQSGAVQAPLLPTPSLWMVVEFRVLWLLWLTALAAAMVLGNTPIGHGSAAATAARMASSVLLVVAAWASYAIWRQSRAERFARLIAIGMTLGAIGDFYNADLLTRLAPLGNPVMGGILAFGLGHVAYIGACLDARRRGRLRGTAVFIGALVAWLAVGGVGWYGVVYLGAGESSLPLVWPALPYSLLLAGTAGLATGLALQNPHFRLLAVGAALFFLSDMLLAFGLFRGGFDHQTEAVWLTYAPGQMLIVFSTLVAGRMLAAVGEPRAA